MSDTRLPFIDFARGYSILSIVLFHALIPVADGMWAEVIRLGGAGVHAFVFLSGFGLSLAALRKSVDGFYRRRIVRVLLPYFLFVTTIFLVNLAWPVYPGRGLYAYLGHILLFKMFDESIISSFGHHLWFLSTIIQLYLVFPLLFHVMQRYGKSWVLGGACLISLIFSVYIVVAGKSQLRVYNSCGIIYLWEFVLGMVLARRYVEQNERFWDATLRWLLPITAIGLSLQAALSLWGGAMGEVLNNPASLVGYGGVLILVYRACQRHSAGWADMALCGLGAIAYELYLVHSLVVTRIYWQLAPVTWPWTLCVALLGVAAAIVAAVAYHQLLALVAPSRMSQHGREDSRTSEIHLARRDPLRTQK